MKYMKIIPFFLANVVLVASQYESDFLNPHNEARDALNVGVAALVWDTTAEEYARSWCTVLRDERNCSLKHSNPGGKYGENLWKWWGSGGFPAPSPSDAVTSWVAEKRYYDYTTNTCAAGKVCGHYTQVVWRNSKRLGCCFIKCNGVNAYLACCNYAPPGNYIGQKPY